MSSKLKCKLIIEFELPNIGTAEKAFEFMQNQANEGDKLKSIDLQTLINKNKLVGFSNSIITESKIEIQHIIFPFDMKKLLQD